MRPLGLVVSYYSSSLFLGGYDQIDFSRIFCFGSGFVMTATNFLKKIFATDALPFFLFFFF